MNPSARNPWKQLGACPFCGHVPPGGASHIISSQTRYMLDVECPKCGGAWRADRATGKLIARLTVPGRCLSCGRLTTNAHTCDDCERAAAANLEQ